MSRITDQVQRIAALAPTPEMLPLLSQMLRDPNANTDAIGVVIRHDMDLAATLLKRCNSVSVRGAEPVESADEALLRLGFNAVVEILMALMSRRMYRLPPEATTHLKGLWHHTLLTAILTRRLVGHLSIPGPTAFTAGLLHDIGKVFLIKAAPREYSQTLEQAKLRHKPCIDQEEEDLGTNHGAVGGQVLAKWNLPTSIVTAVWFHHHTGLVSDRNTLAHAIEVADTMAYIMGHGLADQFARCRNTERMLEELNLTPAALPALIEEALREADAVRQSIG